MKYQIIREEPRGWRMQYKSGAKNFERERVAQDPFEDAQVFEADEDQYGAREAAEEYLDKNFADMSYPKGPVRVWARDENGIVVEIEVEVDFTPVFRAWDQKYGPKHCEHKYVYLGRCSSCETPMAEPAEREP